MTDTSTKANHIVDFQKYAKEKTPETTISITNEGIDRLFDVTAFANKLIIHYLSKIAFEKVENGLRIDNSEFVALDNNAKNDILIDGLTQHFTEFTARTFEKGDHIHSMGMANYFNDLREHLSNYVIKSVISYQEFHDLNLTSYLKDSPSAKHVSTMDIFWLAEEKVRLQNEQVVTATINIALDYSQVFFDYMSDSINNKFGLNSSDINPQDITEEQVREGLQKDFEEMFAQAANDAVNEMANILLDPASKIMFRLFKHLEEAAYNYLCLNNTPLWQTLSRVHVTRSTNQKTSTSSLLIDTYSDWVHRSKDLEVFTRDELNQINLEYDYDQAAVHSTEILTEYTQHFSGENPDDAVIDTHSRRLVMLALYQYFFEKACNNIDHEVSLVLSDIHKEPSETDLDFIERKKSVLMIHDREIATQAIMLASQQTWDVIYPKEPYKLEIYDENET